MKKGIVFTVEQNNFLLSHALSEAAKYAYIFPEMPDNNILKKVISNFLDQLCNPSFG